VSAVRSIRRSSVAVSASLPCVLACALALAGTAHADTIRVSPGANLNAAYQTAKPGDTIELAAGDYGGHQTISKDSGKPLGSAPVTFTARGTVTMSGFTTLANDVEYVGFAVPGSQATVRAGRNVVLRNFRAEKPYIWGPTSSTAAGDTLQNVTIVGGDFGPHPSCGGGFQITRDGPPRDIRIIGNTFHDFTVPAECPTAHLDCLHSFNGIDGLLISGNRFVRCEHFGMLINSASNVTIENNFIEGGIYGFKLRGDNDPSIEVFNNVTIRNNSADHISLSTPGSNTLNNVSVEGNATVERITCRSEARYANNLAEKGSRCSGDLPNVPAIGFADPANGDFHIALSSPAVDRLTGGSASDYDGEPRPQGSGFDIGADEVTQGGPQAGPEGKTRGLLAALVRPILKHVQRWLRVSPRGFVRLRLACRPVRGAPAPKRCRGVAELRRARSKHPRARQAGARRPRRALLARARFATPPRRVTAVKLRLRRRARAAVRRHRIPARVRVAVRSRGTASAVAGKRVVLVRAR
jgi:hypothetical protein